MLKDCHAFAIVGILLLAFTELNTEVCKGMPVMVVLLNGVRDIINLAAVPQDLLGLCSIEEEDRGDFEWFCHSSLKAVIGLHGVVEAHSSDGGFICKMEGNFNFIEDTDIFL
jgi:hypothetical protein